MKSGRTSTPLIASIVFFAAILAFDLGLPLGVAGGALYMAPVLVGLWFPKRRHVVGLAVLGTGLTVLGYLFSSTGGIPWIVLTNRGVALFAIWAAALLVLAYRRIEEKRDRVSSVTTAMLENVGVGVSLTSADLKVVAYNDLFLEFLDFPKDRFEPGDPFEKFVRFNAERGEYGAVDVEEAVRERVETAKRFEPHRFERTRPDGAVIEVRRNPLSDGGFVTTYTDITHRRLADEEVRKLSRAIEQSPVSIIITALNGKIEYVNPKFSEVSGYTWKEVIGRNPRMLKSGHTTAEEYRRLWNAIRSGETWQGEFHNKTKNGNLYWESASISPVRAPDGSITHFVAVKEDITERKLAEERILEANKLLDHQRLELEDMTGQLGLALEKAQASNAAKSEFLANMSHELRTPLNAIIGFSEVMRTAMFGPIGNSKYSEYADDINASGHHLLDLINDILDLSKIEAGKLELHEETVDIRGIIDICLNWVNGRAQDAGLRLEQNVSESVSGLRADERKLKQILLNLISNAIKFTPPGGSVVIEAYVEAARGLVIAVVDSGIGMAPEDLDRVMEPFRQLDGGLERKYDGTGLGLPLTKMLVELHGGTLEIVSRPGAGTTVLARFPAERVQDHAA